MQTTIDNGRVIAFPLQHRQTQDCAQTVEEMVTVLGFSRARAEKIVKAREEKRGLIEGLVSEMQAWARSTGQMPRDTFGVGYGDIARMKPKELKALRARFDAHRRV